MSLSQSQPISMSLSGGSKGAPPRPLFLDQTEGRRAKKNFWDLAPLYIKAWICHCHLLPFLLCYSVYYKVSLLLTSVPLFLIPKKKKPQGTLYQESREWWPFHNIHISFHGWDFLRGLWKLFLLPGKAVSAPLIFGIFLRGMRKNGGEGGSFNCGNVLAHCQCFFVFSKVKLYLTLSIGSCGYYAFLEWPKLDSKWSPKLLQDISNRYFWYSIEIERNWS